MLRGDRQAGHETLRLAILRQEADAVRDRVCRTSKAHLAAVDDQPARVEAIGAGNDARELGASGAEQAGDAERLRRRAATG